MGTPHHFGIYYSPSPAAYRQADLEAFLPHLRALGAKWVVLRADHRRAVPEAFIRGLIAAGFTPLIHLDLPPRPEIEHEVAPLLRAYARWGVQYIAFFDRPNTRSFWDKDWRGGDLPDLFLDVFLPLAQSAHANGIKPILPPLEPGGDYWDTAFLRRALEGIARRAAHLIPALALGAYAWSEGKPLDWGAGGPEAWPDALPYATNTQDQRGFRIFEWYAAHARAAWNREPPIFLLGMGYRYGKAPSTEVEAQNAAIARLFYSDSLPEYLLGGAFWALTAPEGDEIAWISPNGAPKPVVEAIGKAIPPKTPSFPETAGGVYVLLPRKDGRVPAAHLGTALAWLQDAAATVGSSPQEALNAAKVIVVGTPADFPADVRAALASHPHVEWHAPVGTRSAPE